MRKLDNFSVVIILSLLAFAVFVWGEIVFIRSADEPSMAFLEVGQGDATLLVLPGGVKVLTDAGPGRNVVASLERVLSRGDRYIDLAIISHPQLDHFNGFNYLLDNYRFGAFVFNGRSAEAAEWQLLLDKIAAKKIPLITLGAGDKIRYGDNTINILAPNTLYLQSAELNDTSIVELINAPPFRALLTADIDSNVENYLLENFDIEADILKVPHHGSKYSSGSKFLRVVDPKVAVVEVGSSNRYGHPTKEALSRLGAVVTEVFRTDQGGTIEIVAEGQKLKIFAER